VSVGVVGRLKVAPKARLRWDKIEQRHVLLSPERGLSLGATAAEIVQLCDGTRTAAGVEAACVERYGAGGADERERARIEHDVQALIADLLARGLVVAVGDDTNGG